MLGVRSDLRLFCGKFGGFIFQKGTNDPLNKYNLKQIDVILRILGGDNVDALKE